MRIYRVSRHKTFDIGISFSWDSSYVRRINISYGFSYLSISWYK